MYKKLFFRNDTEILSFALETLCNVMSNEIYEEGIINKY